jgi:hypothetical protein
MRKWDELAKEVSIPVMDLDQLKKIAKTVYD